MNSEDKKPTYEEEFVNELMEVSCRDDKDFIEFINSNFRSESSLLSSQRLIKNTRSLKKLDDDHFSVLLSRSERLKESTNLLYYFPAIFGLYTLILSMYTVIRELMGNSDLSIKIYWIVLSVLTVTLTVNIYRAFKKRPTTVYFNALLKSIRYKSSFNDEN